MTPDQVLSRARSATGKSIEYRNGCGGENPLVQLPCDADNRCDCSGFCLWSLGVSRTVRLGHPWRDRFPPIAGMPYGLDTSRIAQDATGAHKAFRAVPEPAPGDLIVYGDWKDASGGRREGHVGIVGQLGEFGGPLTVIHCSRGNWTARGDAILETPVAAFWKSRGAIYARSLMYEAPAVGASGAPGQT